MNIEEVIKYVRHQLNAPLPGSEAHKEALPGPRPLVFSDEELAKARKSAVLLLFFPDGDTTSIALIRRTKRGVHSGQIAFPGGRQEPREDLVDTALRETHEEIGVKPRAVTLLGKLTPLYVPVSQFMVHPYVGYMVEKTPFIAQPEEVDEVIAMPVDALLGKQLQEKKITIRGKEITCPYFDARGHIVWGATAMIMNEMKWIMIDTDHFQP